jgi:uncharacterized cupredoxin-like copper-binding protein
MKIKTLLASTILLLAVAACSGTGGGSAAPTTPTTSSVPSTSASDTAVHVRDFSLDPKDVTVQGTVSLAVTNDGPTIHNVSIRDASGNVVGATKDLKPGQSETLTVGIPAGSYILFCSLPGHESLGIKGTVTVTK